MGSCHDLVLKVWRQHQERDRQHRNLISVCCPDNGSQPRQEVWLRWKVGLLAERGRAVEQMKDDVYHWQVGVSSDDKVALIQCRSVQWNVFLECLQLFFDAVKVKFRAGLT